MRDSISRSIIKRVISAVSVADNTAQVGQIIDHQGHDSAEYDINIGSVADADATFTVLLEEGDAANLADAAAVADADMVSQTAGTAPEAAASFQFDSDNQVRRLAYIGSKRYTRMTITPANNTAAALFGVTCRLGHQGPGNALETQPAS